MVKSWRPWPATWRWNRIWLPSGDQLAVRSATALSVSCISPLPSAFITQTSKSLLPPPMRQLKTIRVPSRDQAGPFLLVIEAQLLCARPVGVDHVDVAVAGRRARVGPDGSAIPGRRGVEGDVLAVR